MKLRFNARKKKGKFVKCENCGKEIYKYPIHIRASKHHFCNNKCHYEWRHKNGIGYNNGILRSDDCKKMISETIKRKIAEGTYNISNLIPFEKGNKPYNYIDGKAQFRDRNITDEEWHVITLNVRKRDNFVCQYCGVEEKLLRRKLSVHHIIPFRITKDNSFSNLISLCSSCHSKVENETNLYLDSNQNPWEIFYQKWQI